VPDKLIVRAFWADAESLFETARSGAQTGSTDCDLAVLIGPQGQIHMREAAGWDLEGLRAEYGAETAYRVMRERGRVRLEGKSGSQTCLLETESASQTARQLLGSHPAYTVLAERPWPAPRQITGQTCTKFA